MTEHPPRSLSGELAMAAAAGLVTKLQSAEGRTCDGSIDRDTLRAELDFRIAQAETLALYVLAEQLTQHATTTTGAFRALQEALNASGQQAQTSASALVFWTRAMVWVLIVQALVAVAAIVATLSH